MKGYAATWWRTVRQEEGKNHGYTWEFFKERLESEFIPRNSDYISRCKLRDALPSPGVNPLEGSPMWSCGIGIRKGAPDFQHYKGVEGHAKSPGIRLGRRTSRSSLILHPKQTTKWLVYIREHPWVLGQITGTLDHKTHHGPDSGEATTFPHIVFSAAHFEAYIQMVLFSETPKLES